MHAAVIGGILLVTGAGKWALGRVWPSMFSKPHQGKGRHRN